MHKDVGVAQKSYGFVHTVREKRSNFSYKSKQLWRAKQ